MTTDDVKQKNRKTLIKLACVAFFMFAFCYMLVPLYTLVCKNLGVNGSWANARDVAVHEKVDVSRTIHVTFSTSIHGEMPFVFKPLIRHVDIHPGQQKLVYFYAQNNFKRGVTVQAIPSITPNEAITHLKKTECFCFTQQYFFSGEKADMPVYFYVDSGIASDIKDITLSYTLFDATAYAKNQKRYTKGRIALNTKQQEG